MRVLVAGASGFVGSRLVPVLMDAGHQVRALTRYPDRYGGPGKAVAGDVADPAAVATALRGCEVAYYLVHSLDTADFAERDAKGARVFGEAAARAGVRRIIYLGGLGEQTQRLSAHLRSRQEVEKLLGAAGVAVTTIRAGVIIGDGGLSWELIRELVMNLPVMITPRWVRTRGQPAAIADVVRYLVAVLETPETIGQVYEIGGPEVLTYEACLHRVARIMRRALVILPVPLLSPKLSSQWLRLVTSVDIQTACNLVESMSNEVVVRDPRLQRLVGWSPMPFDEAVRQALAERTAREAGEVKRAAR